MGLSLWHLVVVVIVVLVVFGAGRLPNVMGDLGKGVRNFKAGLDGKDEKPAEPLKPLADQSKSESDKQG
jgi:sec-independent protein translocase protein TatA